MRRGMTGLPEAAGAVNAEVEVFDDASLREVYGRLVRFAATVALPSLPADEIVQEAFVRVPAKKGETEPIEGLAGYVRRTIVHIASNERRRFARRRRALSRFAASTEEAAPVPDAGSAQEILSVVDARTRAVLHLRLIDGLDYASIGRQLSISEGAARQVKSRGVQRLRAHMQEEDNW